MKISIIGGGGLVGSMAAFALQTGALVRQIALIDANADLAAGQALDLLHGTTVTADQVIRSGAYEQIPDSDCVCITAGLRRKPEESRLDLINRNVQLFLGILDQMRSAGLRKDAVVLVVSNPVDILTYLAAKRLGLGPGQVLGLGTVLDSIRFRSLLAQELEAAPTQVSAVILGEHGDSMVPIWSSASVAGLPLDKHPRFSPKLATDVFQRTKGSGAEVIKLKGGAGFAVGLAIREVVHAIALDNHRVLPISTLQTGAYGIRDVALSLPTVVGRSGALAVQPMELWSKELQGLRTSANLLQQTLREVVRE